MKKLFENMGLKKFRQNSSFLFILTDVWVIGYLYKRFTNKEVMDRLIDIAARQQQLDKSHMEQLYTILTQSLIMMLGLVAIVHLINYVLYNKNKKVAFAYLKFYAWSGAIGAPLWGFSMMSEQVVPGLVFIAIGGCLLFNALGLQHFPFQEKKA